MKKQNLQQPNRPLSINFTDATLRRAMLAKRQHDRLRAIKELFSMEKRNFFKKPAGALAALGIVILGGVGVYAASNWFGGIVRVTSDESTMTVDLSTCQSDNLPPGIDPNVDRSNIKFKIIGHPHISEADLQRKLLSNCEHQTIFALYQQKYGTINSDIGVIKSINSASHTITIEVGFGGKDFEKTMAVAPNTVIYNKGEVTNIQTLKNGDYVMFAFDLQRQPLESENPYDQDIALKSIFKTQNDLREVMKDGKSLYGPPNNIEPLR